jgi:hypothetical protein
MVADVHAAERDRPASAEALANIDALSATATQLAERIAVADRFESIADLDALPEPPAPAEPEAVTPPATPGDAGAPADAAPSTAPAGSAQPAPDAPAPAVVARRGQPGEQSEIREGALTDAIAAAVSSRTDQRIEIDMELRSGTAGTPGVSAMAAAVTIGGQEFGYCGFPAMDDSLTVCGTSEWPEAVAYQSLSTPRLPGQPVLRHNPIRSTNGEGFIWDNEDREAQLLRDGSGDLMLDAQGRPQLDPDAPVKPSVPVICDDDVLTADQMFGRSRVVDAVYPPAKLSALIQTMLNDQVRDAARRSLSWMASQANWQEPGATILSMANRQNAAARFIEGITSALPRIAAPQGVNEIATDLFVPVWFPSVFSGEDYLRPEYIETWATLLAKLTERGVTVRPSLDHFVDTSFDGVSGHDRHAADGRGAVHVAAAQLHRRRNDRRARQLRRVPDLGADHPRRVGQRHRRHRAVHRGQHVGHPAAGRPVRPARQPPHHLHRVDRVPPSQRVLPADRPEHVPRPEGCHQRPGVARRRDLRSGLMPLPTPLLDAIEGDTPIGTDVARLDELWAKVLTGITPLDVVGSIVWDVMPADDCDIDERPDKPLVPAPVLYHIAGTATAVASCQTGAAIPEQGDEGRRLGLEQSLTSGLEALTATSSPYVPKQLNFADLVLRLVGAAADEPFMPGVILTPWLTNPALIVGFRARRDRCRPAHARQCVRHGLQPDRHARRVSVRVHLHAAGQGDQHEDGDHTMSDAKTIAKEHGLTLADVAELIAPPKPRKLG